MSEDNRVLLDLITNVSGTSFRKVEETFGDGFVRLHTSEAERRQAKHDIRSVEDIVIELLRNSRDAGATRIFVASSRSGDVRSIAVIDDGIGVPTTMHARIFEPRVTSKLDSMVIDSWGVHGRGMALYSIKANAADVQIRASATGLGCAIALSNDCLTLPERSDQSTWPTVDLSQQSLPVVTKGPRNILRAVVEFACQHPSLQVYIGSHAEIAATMFALTVSAAESSALLLVDDVDSLHIWQRPGAAMDAVELVGVAASIGLDISERTAHRVLSGELNPLPPILDICCAIEQHSTVQQVPDIYKNRKGLRIHQDDLVEFRRGITAAFDGLAERYFIYMKDEPRIRVTKDAIHVRFEIDKED